MVHAFTHGLIMPPARERVPSKETLAGLNMLAQLWMADYAEHGTRWFDGTPLVQRDAAR